MDQCNILKLNEEELLKISGRIALDKKGARDEIISDIKSRFSIDEVILTMGKNGGKWYSRDNTYTGATPSPETFMNSVGAGDAYAAVCAAGLIKQKPPQDIIVLAEDFAGRICGIKGALPSDESFYNDIIRKMNTNERQ